MIMARILQCQKETSCQLVVQENLPKMTETHLAKVTRATRMTCICRSFEGNTPLQRVGVYGVDENVLIIQRLLAAGANMDEQDGYGRTPISLCCFDSHLNIARLFLEQGADITIADVIGLVALALGHL